MKTILVVLAFALVVPVLFMFGTSYNITQRAEAASKSETRCGWYSDPTPGNAWLTDRQGEWILGLQGGYQAERQENWTREFKPSEWVETNGHHGYGCACMKVTTNKKEMKIIQVISTWPRPLSACRNDRALKGKEPN